MPLLELTGDLFNPPMPLDAIAHGCNTVGVMGAGVAKIVRAKYGEEMFAGYKIRCDSGNFQPGDVYIGGSVGEFARHCPPCSTWPLNTTLDLTPPTAT